MKKLPKYRGEFTDWKGYQYKIGESSRTVTERLSSDAWMTECDGDLRIETFHEWLMHHYTLDLLQVLRDIRDIVDTMPTSHSTIEFTSYELDEDQYKQVIDMLNATLGEGKTDE